MNTININVDLKFTQIVEAVKQLSPKEKLLLNDVLWDENIEIPVEHQNLVMQRINETTLHPERLIDWNLASKSLKS